MFGVEVYASVRRFVFVEGNSQREAARVFGLHRETVAKMCQFSLSPGYTRKKPVEKPKLGPLAHPPGHAQVDFGEAVGIIGVNQAVRTAQRATRPTVPAFISSIPF